MTSQQRNTKRYNRSVAHTVKWSSDWLAYNTKKLFHQGTAEAVKQ